MVVLEVTKSNDYSLDIVGKDLGRGSIIIPTYDTFIRTIRPYLAGKSPSLGIAAPSHLYPIQKSQGGTFWHQIYRNARGHIFPVNYRNSRLVTKDNINKKTRTYSESGRADHTWIGIKYNDHSENDGELQAKLKALFGKQSKLNLDEIVQYFEEEDHISLL